MTDYAKDIWKMANALRGNTSAEDYKYYILGFIVYRYLSTKQEKFLSTLPDDSDTETCLKLVLQKYGFAINPEDTWKKIIEKAKNKSLTLEDLENVFSHFNENLYKINNNESREYFENLFSNIDLNNVGSITSMALALSKVALKIDSINIYNEEGHDVLGDIYEALIAKFASGKNAGEFYTPHIISRLLSKLTTVNIKQQQNLDIMDFAMGSGALLLTYADAVPGGHKKGIIHFYGQEILTETYNLARMNLMMHDVDYKYITLRNGDTLGNDWPANKKMDIISANPPYGNQWDNTADREQDPRFEKYAIAPKGYSEYAFVLHGLYHLKESGTMGVVLPNGVLFRGSSEKKIRKQLIKNNLIDAIIGLPEKMFYSTDIPTIIMILKKNKKDDDVLFIDASNEYEKVKKHNKINKENIDKIVAAYKGRKDLDKYAHVASYQEIKENDFNLNITRYVDSFEPEPDVDLDEVTTNLSNINENINNTKRAFNEMKSDLVETDVYTNDK